jgi:hypothetical protein
LSFRICGRRLVRGPHGRVRPEAGQRPTGKCQKAHTRPGEPKQRRTRIARDTYTRATRRARQPPPHDASYFNLNNTETPTTEPFTRLGGLQLEVGAPLVGVEARVCRSSFRVLVAVPTPATVGVA